MTTIHQKIERVLYKLGYTVPSVRRLVRSELYLTAAVCVAAILLFYFSDRPLHFAAGALLVAFNVFGMARFVQNAVHIENRRRAVVALLIRFNARLLVTGVLAYALIVWAQVSPIWLLAGITTLVLSVLVFGGAQVISFKLKEV